MAHGRHDAEGGAAKRGIHLGHQFFEGIFLGTEGAEDITVQLVRRSATYGSD